MISKPRGISQNCVYNKVREQMKGGGAVQEEEIVKLIKNRNEAGIEELLRRYGPLIRYIIMPILHNAQDQEECVSEVAMRVWDKIDLYDNRRGSWNAWLTALTRNTALNRARRNKRFDATADILPETPSPAPTPEEMMLQKERQEAVKRALHQLSSKERALFYRKYYYLQPTAQIASELGMTKRAVEGKLYRLKKRLRKILGGDGHEVS